MLIMEYTLQQIEQNLSINWQ